MKNLLGDGDTGWHIRTGQWIAANHMVPNHDLFSYSKPNEVWFAWEWISDLIWAWLNAHGGLAAVALAAILIISATFTIVFRLVRRSANPIVAISVTMIAAAASSIHWLARPHLFTFLFVAIFYTVLERVRGGNRKYLWALPALTVAWTNLHGGFVVGMVMIACYGVAELLKWTFDPAAESRRAAIPQARRYFLCALGCLAASLLNPYTYHLHVHVWQYLRDPYQSQHILEFLSISFHHPIALFFEAMLLLGAGAAFASFRNRSYVEAVLIVIFAHGGLLAARNIPLYAIVAAPPVAAMLAQWLAAAPQLDTAAWFRAAARKFNEVAASMTETDAVGRWHAVSALGVAILAALIFAPHPPKKFRPEFDPTYYPASAVTKISREVLGRDASAHIFTYDQWGDYLIYRLYPKTRVFIDGRSDFYGDDFETKYVDALNVKYGWEMTLAHFGVDTVLLPPATPLTGALKLSSDWRVIYDDGVAVVFRAKSARAANADPQAGVKGAAATGVAANGIAASNIAHAANSQVSTTSAMGRGIGRDRGVTKTGTGDRKTAKPQSTI